MRKRNPSNRNIQATLLLTSTLTVMAGATIAPALPAMREQFSAFENVDFLVRMVLTLPALFIAIMAPIAGIVVDQIGRKKILVLSTLIYGLSGTAGYLAPTLGIVLISRALLGISVGGVMTSVTTLIADYYDGEARSRFMGLQAGFMGLGGTLFLMLGGVLADISWRGPFLIYLAAFVVLPAIILVLYEPTPAEQCVEMPNPVSDPGECVAGAIRVEKPIALETEIEPVPTQLILFVYTLMIGIQIIFYLIPVQLPFYLLDLTGASASQSGTAIAVVAFFYALASMQYGWVDARLSHLEVLTIGFGLVGIGYLVISVAGGWVAIILGLVLGGVGLGLMVPNLNVWLANETPARMRGRVLGGFTTALFLGQFLSPLISQPVSAAIGISGVYLSAGALLLLLVPLSILTRRQLYLLTG